MSMDMVMADWVRDNHKRQKIREREMRKCKADHMVSIKETILAAILFIVIILMASYAGEITGEIPQPPNTYCDSEVN